MATALGGKGGSVEYGGTPTTLVNVKAWSLSETHAANPYNNSDTDGETARVAGNTDRTGTFTVNPDANISALVTSTAVALILNISASRSLQGNAIITGRNWTCDIESGAPIELEYSFEQNGAWTET